MNLRKNKPIFLRSLSAMTGLSLFPAACFAAVAPSNALPQPSNQAPFNGPLPNLPLPDQQTSGNADFTPFPSAPEPEPVAKQVEAPKMSPELRRLLNISALKSEFMLIALTCNQHKEYDNFMTKFRPVLQEGYQSLKIDFHKLYGTKGEMRLDQYMTDLADAASLKAAREGGNFCKTHVKMFHEAEYFQTPEDLAAYAEAKNLAVPLPKSPTGRRDSSPVTLPESESFANFAHPSFTPRKQVSHQNPKPTSFVPIKKSAALPPLEEQKSAPKSISKENTPSEIHFPETSVAKPSPPPQTLLPAPQPYPDLSTNP